MLSNIIAATDGSAHAQNAQNLAIDMAAKYGARITFVHVLTHDHPSEELKRMVAVENLAGVKKEEASSIPLIMEERYAFSRPDTSEARVIVVLGERILKNASDSAKKAGVKNVAVEIRSGDYANCILKAAEEGKADLIVLGRRGLSTLKGFVTGSVSHKVTQRASCSVMTVK
jgi:nucleotide-binding universal stress UspA family protein